MAGLELSAVPEVRLGSWDEGTPALFGCLLALSLSRPAAALHLSGVFGGAVRAGGASAYWNPAAVWGLSA